MSDASHRGAKIGPRIAALVSQSIVATHRALLGTKHKLGMALFNSMSDQISEEVHKTVGPYLQAISEHPASDDVLKAATGFLATQHGQLTAMSGITMVGQSILGSLAEIINNAAAPAVRDVIRQSPNLAIDPNTLAQIVSRGIASFDDAIGDVEGQGFNQGQFAALSELARNYPAIADSLELYRRGEIDSTELDLHFERNGLPEATWPAMRSLVRVLISPADAALAVLRGNITQAQGVAIAERAGITSDDFQILLDNTGEPLGLEQLLEAYRRKFITKATLEEGIRQSRVRNEWIGTAEALRYVPMSVSDAVNAVVQNQLAMSEGTDIADQNGLTPGAFETLYNTAGEPLSRGEMLELYNRGEVTEEQVLQASRESRLKNKYNSIAFLLHERLLEPRMLSSAVQYGSITVAEATRQAMAYGYSQELAKVVVGEGTARKLQTYKDAIVRDVETLYENNAIDSATAIETIVAMGHSQDEATFIIEAADMRRTTKTVNSAISAIRSKFLGRHVTAEEATQLLQTLGVPPAQVSYNMAEWTLEQQAYTRTLTESQIQKAVKLGLIDPAAGLQRLIDMGYSEDDAALLIQGA